MSLTYAAGNREPSRNCAGRPLQNLPIHASRARPALQMRSKTRRRFSPEVGANMRLPPAAPNQRLGYFRQLRVLVAIHQIARGNILSEHPIEAIDAFPAAPVTALERQLPVITAGGEVGAEGDVLEAGNIDDVLEVADIVVDTGLPPRILVPAHRAIDAGTDHAARLRHCLDDFVGLVALQIGESARVGMRNQDRLRGNLDHAKHCTLADMGKIDGNADLIHYFHGITAKQREARLFGLKATVAKRVPKLYVSCMIRSPSRRKKYRRSSSSATGLMFCMPIMMPTLPSVLARSRSAAVSTSSHGELGRLIMPCQRAISEQALREVSLEMASRDVQGIDATHL